MNTVATPLSMKLPDAILRVVFLGSKQKAAESRRLGEILRTACRISKKIDTSTCYLKDKLCMHCPRCALFGAMTIKPGSQEMNFRHRIEYSSAFSLLPYEDIEESLTFNAIDEVTSSVGQALGETPNVFPSIVTLNTVTWKEFLLAVKTLLATKSYGAEGRIKGDVHNAILGIVAGWEEVISPLELTLELYDVYSEKQGIINCSEVYDILESYQGKASFVNKVKVLTDTDVSNICREIQMFDLTKEFLDEAYKDVEYMLNKANTLEGKKRSLKPEGKRKQLLLRNDAATF